VANDAVELIMELVDVVARIAPPEGVEWLTAQLVFDRTTFRRRSRLQGASLGARRSPRRCEPAADSVGGGKRRRRVRRAALVLAAIGSIDRRSMWCWSAI